MIRKIIKIKMNYFIIEIIKIKVKMSMSGADLCYLAVAEDVSKSLDSIQESDDRQDCLDRTISLYEYVLDSSFMKNSVFRNVIKEKIIQTEIIILSYIKDLQSDFECPSNRKQYLSVINLLHLLYRLRNMY